MYHVAIYEKQVCRTTQLLIQRVFLKGDFFSQQTVSIPWVELVNNGEKTIQYSRDHVQVTSCDTVSYVLHDMYTQDEVLEAALERSYNMFKVCKIFTCNV